MNKIIISFFVVMIAVTLERPAPAAQPPVSEEPELRCGAYCLYLALNMIGHPSASFEAIEQALGPPGEAGYSMQQLAEVARRSGAHCEGFQTDLQSLQKRQRPFACIALLKKGHFVVVYDVDDENVYVVDPPKKILVGRDGFASLWSGKTLLLADRPIVRDHRRWIILAEVAGGVALGAFGLWWFTKRRSAPIGRNVAAALAIAVTSLAGCERSETGRPLGPRIGVEPRAINLGRSRISLQGTVRSALILRNKGSEPLKIWSIHSSCGCTVVSAPRATIAPSESAKVSVEVKVGFEPGSRTSKINIVSNDPTTPDLEVPVRWEAEARISAEPPSVGFGQVRPGETATRNIQVKQDKADAGKPLRIIAEPPGMKAVWGSPTDEPRGRGRELRVTVAASAPLGDHRAFLTLLGDEPDLILTIPVHWAVAANYSGHPSALFSSRQRPGDPLEVAVFITTTLNGPFRITNVLLDERDLKDQAVITPLDSNRQKIRLTTAAPSEPGLLRRVITVKVKGDEGDDKVEIPWTVVIPK